MIPDAHASSQLYDTGYGVSYGLGRVLRVDWVGTAVHLHEEGCLLVPRGVAGVGLGRTLPHF